MPVRARRRLPDLTGDVLADLAAHVAVMSPDELDTFTSVLEPEHRRLLQSAWAKHMGQGWRASPAAMAEHVGDVPGMPRGFRRWRYVELLSSKMVDAVRGDDPRQVWNLPSQYGKTTVLCTIGVPWILQDDPTRRVMYVTFDANKAVEEGGKARDWIEAHPELGIELRPDRRARGMWRTRQGGGLYCVGIYGGIVGWPVDVMLLDDLIKGWQVAHSETQREAVWSIYRSQVRMRIQGTDCPIILAGTRWHEDDPSGRALNPPDVAGAEAWTHVRLPAVAEAHDPASHDPLSRLPDPLGRAPGEVLEPERFDADEVRARAATLGSYLASALEQQRPAPEEGTELLRSWFRLEEQVPTRPDESCTSWDLKLKDREAGDYVVGQVWWRVGGGFWLVDQLRGQWDHATTANAIALLAVRHPEVAVHVVEAAGSADEVLPKLKAADPDYVVSDDVADRLGMNDVERRAVQRLRRRGMSGLKPEKVTDGDKQVRARAYIAPNAEAGDVHLPAGAAWLPHWLDEVVAFPNGAHDDQVDAASQALRRLSRQRTATASKAQAGRRINRQVGQVPATPAPTPGRQRATISRAGSRGRRR